MLTPHTWTKSSRSGANGCITTRWHKSSYSSDSFNCVETRRDGTIHVRDSKDQRADAPILQFHPETWRAFIHAITTGEVKKP